MNKRKSAMALCVASFASLGAVVIGASYKAAGNLFFAKADAAGVWMHYAKKAASKGSDGIREYWVNCQTNEHVFTEPTGATIQEGTKYDTSGFATDDDRWIKAVTLSAQEVLMTDSTKTFDLGEYASGTVSSIKAGTFDLGTDASNLDVSGFAADHSDDGTKAVEIETTKDGKEYVLYFDTTFVTANIASVADFQTYILPYTAATDGGKTTYTDTNKFGYYKLTADNLNMNAQIKYSSSDNKVGYFAGTLDGCGKTILSPSNTNHGLFSNLRNATIKNLTINDTYFSGGGYICVLARHAFQTTLENVTIKIVATSTAVAAEGYTPECKSGYGWLSWHTFQANTIKNCVFDASGYKLGSLFGWNGSMTMPTVTDSVVKSKSLTQAMYSQYLAGKGEPATFQPENVTLKDGEVAIKGLTWVEA